MSEMEQHQRRLDELEFDLREWDAKLGLSKDRAEQNYIELQINYIRNEIKALRKLIQQNETN